MENAVVIGQDGQGIFWHTPDGRSVAHIPDSQDLWEYIWENREDVKGIAHSHPGGGIPSPSREDVTTFAAIESALGRRLDWWIISRESAVRFRKNEWEGAGRYEYHIDKVVLIKEPEHWDLPLWVNKLWKISYTESRVVWPLGGPTWTASHPDILCECQSNWMAWPKAAWAEESRALLVCADDQGVVLEYEGVHLAYEFGESSTQLIEENGLRPPHDGVFIWTGKLQSSYDPYTGEHDSWLDGDFRQLTDEEWNRLRSGKGVLEPSKFEPCDFYPCEDRKRLEKDEGAHYVAHGVGASVIDCTKALGGCAVCDAYEAPTREEYGRLMTEVRETLQQNKETRK